MLIVPAVLAIGGYLFTRTENRNSQAIQEERTRDSSVQGYLEQMGQLLLDKNLRGSHEDDDVRTVARARTLTVLEGLNPQRKGSLVRFLYESNLINGTQPVVNLGGVGMIGPVAGGADLKKIDLAFVYLGGINLSGSDITGAHLAFTDLQDSDLSEALLFDADMGNADLTNADFRYALLSDTDLSDAILENANLEGANLEKADLRLAKLNDANLTDAELGAADLREADLTNAIVSNEQLAECKSLQGATMPDGQKYED